MSNLANLNESDLAPEMIDNALISLDRPPFYGKVIFAAGRNNPERNIATGQFVHL